MFGHLASSHTVCSFSSRSLDLMSTYLSPPGTLLLSQSGLRVFSCDVHHLGCQMCIHGWPLPHSPQDQAACRQQPRTEVTYWRKLTFQCGAATEYPLGTLLLSPERKSSKPGPAQVLVVMRDALVPDALRTIFWHTTQGDNFHKVRA